MKKLLLFAFVVLGFSAASYAQLSNTASANATADIYTALTIEKIDDLSFGAIGAKTSATTAVISTTGSRSASTADLLAISTGAAATFEVKGDADASFAITFPDEDVLLQLAGQPDMKILEGDFTAKIDASGDSNAGSIDDSGTSIVKVGATLQVGASQPKGSYTGIFEVTVNYN